MAKSIYPRSIQHTLKLALADTPVVALLGPRQWGKSTLVRALAPERAYVTLDEEQSLRTALDDPVGFVAALPARVTLDEVSWFSSLSSRPDGPIRTCASGTIATRTRWRWIWSSRADARLRAWK